MPCCVTKFLGKQHHVKWGLFKVKNSIDNTIAEYFELTARNVSKGKECNNMAYCTYK